MVPNTNYSGLLRKYKARLVLLAKLEKTLELKNAEIRGRSKP